jgi:hypothetical protein
MRFLSWLFKKDVEVINKNDSEMFLFYKMLLKMKKKRPQINEIRLIKSIYKENFDEDTFLDYFNSKNKNV